MTKEEQNAIIKETWTRNLRKETDLPTNIGTVYINWLREKIVVACNQLLSKRPQGEQQMSEQPANGPSAPSNLAESEESSNNESSSQEQEEASA